MRGLNRGVAVGTDVLLRNIVGEKEDEVEGLRGGG